MKTIMKCLLGPIIFTVVPSMIAACVVFCFIIAIYERSSVAFCLYCLMGVSSILVRKQVSNWNFCSIFIFSCSWICHSPTTATTKSLELLDKQKYLSRWIQYLYFYNQVLLTIISHPLSVQYHPLLSNENFTDVVCIHLMCPGCVLPDSVV